MSHRRSTHSAVASSAHSKRSGSVCERDYFRSLTLGATWYPYLSPHSYRCPGKNKVVSAAWLRYFILFFFSYSLSTRFSLQRHLRSELFISILLHNKTAIFRCFAIVNSIILPVIFAYVRTGGSNMINILVLLVRISTRHTVNCTRLLVFYNVLS